MIAQAEVASGSSDVWARIAAPVAPEAISWRQDGRAVQRDGKYVARFVAYIEANTVRERLDEVVPGEWDLTLELLPTMTSADPDGVDTSGCSFKARLQVLGVIREDVGNGKDYKQAATDAFKRAAVRFGIGHELYAYEQNWVEVDGDGRYAKPVEDPAVAYERRMARAKGSAPVQPRASAPRAQAPAQAAERPVAEAPAAAQGGEQNPDCPVCGGRMWDNRATKRNPRAPDYKCRDRSCDGVVWPPKADATAKPANPGKQPVSHDGVGMDRAFEDDIPF